MRLSGMWARSRTSFASGAGNTYTYRNIHRSRRGIAHRSRQQVWYSNTRRGNCERVGGSGLNLAFVRPHRNE